MKNKLHICIKKLLVVTSMSLGIACAGGMILGGHAVAASTVVAPVVEAKVTPSPSPSPSPSPTPRPVREISSDFSKEARRARVEIDDYADICKVGQPQEIQNKISDTAKAYKDKIAKKINDNGEIRYEKADLDIESFEECISAAKEAIDALIQTSENTQPSSSSDLIMVGGDWITPEATYGQAVNIVLPLVNMGMPSVTNVTVTPIVSNSVHEWPFVIETSGYTQTIPLLPGKENGQSDMDRRRELTWTLRTRDDALSGYTKLQFNVLYYNGTEVENCTLTTYVKIHGAAGSGNIESEGGGTSTPRIIVTGYTTNPAQVHAGDTFTLTLHLKNTSKRTAVSNMLLTFSAPSEGTELDNSYAVFLPTNGSNSVYVDGIGKGAEKDVSIELSSKRDMSQKPYQLDVNMEFEDEEYATFTSSTDVSIPIYQDARFELSKPEILPQELQVGSEANVMFSIYNLGRVTLYNVHVSFESESVSGGEVFLGKIEAGGVGSVDAMVKGENATSADKPVKVVVSYEDETGEKHEYKEDLELTVSGSAGAGFDSGLDPYGDFDEFDYEEEQPKSKVLPIIIGVGLGILLIVVIVVVVKLIKKKKEQKENMSLLSDLEDAHDAEEGEGDEIS